MCDDDNFFSTSLCEQIELYREFETIMCATANDLLVLIRTQKIGCIFLDIGLQGMNGRYAYRIMRRNGIPKNYRNRRERLSAIKEPLEDFESGANIKIESVRVGAGVKGQLWR